MNRGQIPHNRPMRSYGHTEIVVVSIAYFFVFVMGLLLSDWAQLGLHKIGLTLPEIIATIKGAK